MKTFKPATSKLWPLALLPLLAAGNAIAEDASIVRSAAIGLRVAPLPLDMKGKNPTLVGYGSYLVNVVATCNGCHSTKEYADGYNPFLGQKPKTDPDAYLRGGASFGPDVVSANIRPDPASGLPGDMTFEQFANVMRHGTDPHDATKLLQVMPWPSYKWMSGTELKAIYQYLSALPPAE